METGGYDDSERHLPSSEIFPSFHTCSIPDLPQPRVDHSTSLLPEGRIVVCGGMTPDTRQSSTPVRAAIFLNKTDFFEREKLYI